MRSRVAGSLNSINQDHISPLILFPLLVLVLNLVDVQVIGSPRRFMTNLPLSDGRRCSSYLALGSSSG
ncbi:hypothetical protein BC832DRAFT_480327 [Gaertneriomyces semiglobifer]|nr:hypothetical protein BC832DRAFT_480327 [Gaertneriomyces semiglobifer]